MILKTNQNSKVSGTRESKLYKLLNYCLRPLDLNDIRHHSMSAVAQYQPTNLTYNQTPQISV